MHEPIAYTFDADYHCPDCTLKRFGRDADGWIAGDAEDSEANPVHAVAPWDEWWDPTVDVTQTLTCGTCHGVIDTMEGEDDDDA